MQCLTTRVQWQFCEGWDAVRNETLARQKALGMVPVNTELPLRDASIEAWDNLTDDEKKVYERLAEVHAAYIDYTDEQIGRFIDYLNESDLLNNTMIVVIRITARLQRVMPMAIPIWCSGPMGCRKAAIRRDSRRTLSPFLDPTKAVSCNVF